MNPKTPSKHGNIGMPQVDRSREDENNGSRDDSRQFASQSKAMEYAVALAARNAELMRRLA